MTGSSIALAIAVALVAGGGLLALDARRRDPADKVGVLLRRSLAFVPRHGLRAPAPLLAVVGLSAWDFILQTEASPLAVLSNLGIAVASFFMMTSGLRCAYRAHGRAYGPGLAGVAFGRVEGVALIGGAVTVLGVVLALLVGAAAIWLARLGAVALGGGAWHVDLATGASAGLAAVLVLAAGLRLSLLIAHSAAQRRLDVAGAWAAGRGRLWPLLAVMVVSVLGLLAAVFAAYAAPFPERWVAGVFAGLAQATYNSFAVGALAQLALQAGPPRP